MKGEVKFRLTSTGEADSDEVINIKRKHRKRGATSENQERKRKMGRKPGIKEQLQSTEETREVTQWSLKQRKNETNEDGHKKR